MFPPKNLNFTSSRTHPFDHRVRFIWFPTRFSHFADYHIGIETPIGPGWELEVAGVIDVGLDAH
jgi:hypothetical protein